MAALQAYVSSGDKGWHTVSVQKRALGTVLPLVQWVYIEDSILGSQVIFSATNCSLQFHCRIQNKLQQVCAQRFIPGHIMDG